MKEKLLENFEEKGYKFGRKRRIIIIEEAPS